MARHTKNGLKYFPLDIDIFSDEKLIPVCVEFGIKGQISVIHLLCAIYRNGYFIEWTESFRYRLAQSMPSVSVDLLDTVVARLVKWGFFDKALFDSAHILTSVGIQRRYFSAVRRRKRPEDTPYLLLEAPKSPPETKPSSPLLAPSAPPPWTAADIIVGTEANARCLARFFHEHNRANLDALAKNFGLTPDSQNRLRLWAERIIREWNITERTHSGYSDWSSHLVRLMWNEKSKDETNPKSKPFTPPAALQQPLSYDYSGGFGGQDT